MNLPNKISVARICMIPVFVLFFFLDAVPYNYLISAVIFALAALTDLLDGHIARDVYKRQPENGGRGAEKRKKLFASAVFLRQYY